ADAFNYAYQPWTGDGSIRARVASVTNTHAWAKAGVMIRSTLDPGSVHAFALVSAASGVSFIRRTATNGTSVSTTTSGIAPPRWIRIDRSGSTVTAYQSSDGTTWTQMGTVTLAPGQSPYIGFAVTSHNNA